MEQFVIEGQAAAFAFLDKREALKVGDTVGPGVELLRLLEGVDLGEDDAIALLQHVFGVAGTDYEGEDVAVETRLEPFKQFLVEVDGLGVFVQGAFRSRGGVTRAIIYLICAARQILQKKRKKVWEGARFGKNTGRRGSGRKDL